VQPFFITGTDLTQEPEFDLKAQAGLLMEVNSNKIIWEENSHERLYPASLTKIMSLLVVLEQLERKYFFLEDQVQISAGASAMGGSELFLSEGDVVSLRGRSADRNGGGFGKRRRGSGGRAYRRIRGKFCGDDER